MNGWEYIEEVILMLVLLMVTAFCSAAETAYSAALPEKLRKMSDENKFGANLATRLQKNFDEALSSILIANTVVCVALSSVGAVVFGDIVGSDEYGAAVSGVILTVFLLLFGEISPKLLAKELAEKTACFLAYPLSFMVLLLKPFCFMISFWKSLLIRFFKNLFEKQ